MYVELIITIFTENDLPVAAKKSSFACPQMDQNQHPKYGTSHICVYIYYVYYNNNVNKVPIV